MPRGTDTVELTRSYSACSACGAGLFPLDDRPGLLPRSTFSPRIHACLVRLGDELLFERVPDLARVLLGVVVSIDTVRTIVLGTVETAGDADPHTTGLRYFSRLCSAEAAAIRDAAAGYLRRRRSQIACADFRAAGHPISSGAVESANKLVVEARLKASGMHWSRSNATPMLALRTIACPDAREQTWPALWHQLKKQARERQQQRWRARHETQRIVDAPSTTHDPLLSKEPPKMVDGHATEYYPWEHGYHPELLVSAQARVRT